MNSVFQALQRAFFAGILLSALLLSGCSEKKQAGPPVGGTDQKSS
jgi:hypothetical protein